MKQLLSYRNSDYFNSEDYYVVYTNLDSYYVTQCNFYNGCWFTNCGLCLKLSSILSVSFAEIYGREVKYKNTSLEGKIIKVLDGSLGVLWHQGGDYRTYGLPNFWNKPINLEI